MAEYIPRYAGTYTLTIELGGVAISGSPWTTIVSPGEIDPTECSHSIPVGAGESEVAMVAGITHFFEIITRDINGNLIKSSRENTTVEITAVYENHVDWTSPLSVPDFLNWEEIYGRDIAGLAAFDNTTDPDSDSTYRGQVTIYRAGTFTLQVRINGIDVQESPMPAWLRVAPSDLYAPNSIVQGLLLQMTAGDTYTAQIQARDFYSNNMKVSLADAAESWRAELVLLDPSGSNEATVVSTGTISDSTDSGVFDFTFTPELSGTSFKIVLYLNGLEVDSTAEYRSTPLVVLPALDT